MTALERHERHCRDDSAAARRAATFRGSWDLPGEPDGPEEAASQLAGAIDYAFNPVGGDSDQASLLIEPVLAAMRFIEDLPCLCGLTVVPVVEDGTCDRCQALGRHHDVRQPR